MPNPITSTGIPTIADHLAGQSYGSDYPVLTNARFAQSMNALAPGGHLDGVYASTSATVAFERATEPTQIFEYTRSDQRFDEVMAYYWVTQSELYIQSLGFKNINNRQLLLNVNGTTDDNSFYQNGSLTFGTGGIRDAEDAEVILHETGHSIQDSQVPGLLDTDHHDIHSMSEGFSDYWAASFFADQGPKSPAWDVFFDQWDGSIGVNSHPAANGNPPYLRRLDSSKHFPEDLDQEVHDDGEMWSACLWNVRRLLGRTASDKLLLESNFFLTPDATYADAAEIIMTTYLNTTPQANRTPEKMKMLRQIFVDRGFIK